ncbi:MAG: plasmid mobilization relaxosome protein MobC [Pseudomonadota bacterium]
MSTSPQQISTAPAGPAFRKATKGPSRKRRPVPPPFSLRLNADERARLERDAAGLPLGTHIKDKLFEDEARPTRRRASAPVKDHAALAQVLGMLGAMRLANNLNQLAKAANIGTLPLTPEVEVDLTKACAAIFAIRAELMRALGYPSSEDA